MVACGADVESGSLPEKRIAQHAVCTNPFRSTGVLGRKSRVLLEKIYTVQFHVRPGWRLGRNGGCLQDPPSSPIHRRMWSRVLGLFSLRTLFQDSTHVKPGVFEPCEEIMNIERYCPGLYSGLYFLGAFLERSGPLTRLGGVEGAEKELDRRLYFCTRLKAGSGF